MWLELSEQHINVIAEALANTPYRMSAPVIAELQKQINTPSKTNDEIEEK